MKLDLIEAEDATLRASAQEAARARDALQDELDVLVERRAQEARRDIEQHSDPLIREELHRQAEYVRTLERRNQDMERKIRVLTDKQQGLDVLKEEKRDLERKARHAAELVAQVGKLQAELDLARSQLAERCA